MLSFIDETLTRLSRSSKKWESSVTIKVYYEFSIYCHSFLDDLVRDKKKKKMKKWA